MVGSEVTFRAARPEDAAPIADLFDMSNGGGMEKVWGYLAGEGETWRDVAMRFIRTPGHDIGYTSTVVAEVEGKIAGMIITRPIPDVAVDVFSLPEESRAYAELKNIVLGSFYLSNMAVFPEWRGHGIARYLLDMVIRLAYETGFTLISAIVHETNAALLAHYDRRGMTVVASAPVGKKSAYDPDSRWLLLTCSPPDGFVKTKTGKSDTDGQ